MSQETAERLLDWAAWYEEHYPYARSADPDVAKRFILKALDGAMECIALAIRDIQRIEEGQKAERLSLMLPSSVRFRQ